MTDPVLEAFDAFADAVEVRLAAMRTEIAELKSGALSVRAPVAEPQSVDEGVLKALVQDAVSRLPAPEAGQPGRDVDMAAVGKKIEDAVAKIPKPVDGKSGVDGKSVDPDEIQRMVAKKVEAAVAAIPRPRDGEKGKDADMETIQKLITLEARKAVAELPPAPPGRDGTPGTPGQPGRDGGNGRDGKDALSAEEFRKAIAEAEERGAEAAVTKLYETFSIEGREAKLGGRVVGRIPATIYRKKWLEDAAYEPGDLVSFGGSIWHANTPSKGVRPRENVRPGEEQPEWTLAVKRGNDAKSNTVVSI